MKKLIAILLSLTILTGAVSITAFAWDIVTDDTYTLGDTNDDGVFNARDSLCLKGFIAESTDNEISKDAADINADGVVNARDSLLIRACLAGMVSLSDYDSEESIYKLTVGGIDIGEYCIVVPAGSTEADNVYYAADQLRKYIRMATGINLRICDGTPQTDYVINFNAVDETSELGKQLGVEGYKYTVENGRAEIYGTRRGNMYAVYEILENYLGYRYYSSGAVFMYKSRTVDIPDGTNVSFQPKLSFRYCAQSFGRDGATEYFFPRRLNGTQIGGYEEPKYGTLTGPNFINAHSFLYHYAMAHGAYTGDGHDEINACYNSGLEWIEQYNKEHPKKPITNEAWQPCGTSDAVYNDLFTGMLRIITMIQTWGYVLHCDAGTTSMSFSICDNTNYCTCRACSAKANVQGEGYSGVYVDTANRAARDIQAYYPGMKIYMIIYDHTVPKTVRPDKNLIIMYCGTACNNHFIGSGECGDDLTPLGSNNNYDEYALPQWAQFCKDSGAELWFWYYPVTYAYYLIGCPNILNIYYDYKYLIESCNVTGIYYEGGGRDYNFETLKAYLSSKMMWQPDMSYEQFTDIMKEYLYMYYGDGYEELYQLILMEDEAGNEAGCFINNHDRPWDMYSKDYLDAHYEEMRALLVTAYEKAGTYQQKDRVYRMFICFDFLGLASSYERIYTNGDAASRATFESRYLTMFNYVKDNGMDIYCNDSYTMPARIDFTQNPMTYLYELGSYRLGI